MTDQDHVDFCNVAYGLRVAAEEYFATKGDEDLRQLNAVVRAEIEAAPAGKVEPGFNFAAAILAEVLAGRAA